MTNRKISFLFFLGAVVAVGIYFFKIVQPFLLPLLVAATMALLIHPAFRLAVEMLRGHRRVAAALMSVAVVILVVLPASAVLAFATQELIRYGEEVVVGDNASDDASVNVESLPIVNKAKRWVSPYLSEADIRDVRENAISIGRSALAEISRKTTGLIADVFSFIVGSAVMILAFYYFLAEGPTIAQEVEKVLPFDSEDEVTVLKQFDVICRGVVFGTLAGAIAQATLVGIALGILQVPGTWLLACLTLIAAMIPFVGSSAVYVPVSLFLYWNGRYAAGTFLLLFGAILVSSIDNLIRAHMIHGTSRLHPLIALVSALGAIKLVGLWGIFVGPVVAGIFYALLTILQEKLTRMEKPLTPATVAPR